MTVEELRKIALAHSGVTEDIKWSDHLCFNAGGKMFLVTSPDSLPAAASFKVSEEQYDEVLSFPGFSRHSHLARHHWVHLDDISRLTAAQWQEFISGSYLLVAKKLSLKMQHSLGLL